MAQGFLWHMPLPTAQSATRLGVPVPGTTRYSEGCSQSLLGSSPDCFTKPPRSAGKGSTKASSPVCKVSKGKHELTRFLASSVGWSYHASDSVKFSDTSSPLEGVGTLAVFWVFSSPLNLMQTSVYKLQGAYPLAIFFS